MKNKGFWVDIDFRGYIKKIRMNYNSGIKFEESKLFIEYIDDEYIKQFLDFQKFDKEDEIDETEIRMNASCDLCNYKIYIFNSGESRHIFGICCFDNENGVYKEIIRINSKLINSIRKETKEKFDNFKEKEYDEITKLNNNLINTKRLLEKKNAQIQRLLDKDYLTGANSRDYLYRYFNSIINNGKKNFIFILVDIDNFKHVNDKYSHKAGDDLLVYITDEMINSFNKSEEIVGRIGGDEFCCIVYNRTKSEIENIFGDINKNIKKKYDFVKISYGLIPINKDNNSFEYYYSLSDERMYNMKNKNKERERYKSGI